MLSAASLDLADLFPPTRIPKSNIRRLVSCTEAGGEGGRERETERQTDRRTQAWTVGYRRVTVGGVRAGWVVRAGGLPALLVLTCSTAPLLQSRAS